MPWGRVKRRVWVSWIACCCGMLVWATTTCAFTRDNAPRRHVRSVDRLVTVGPVSVHQPHRQARWSYGKESRYQQQRRRQQHAMDAWKDASVPNQQRPTRVRATLVTMAQFALSCATLVAFYLFHMVVLTQHMAILFGCWAVGYDTLVGAAIAVGYSTVGYRYRPRRRGHGSWPWHLPSAPPRSVESSPVDTTVAEADSSSMPWNASVRRWIQSGRTATATAGPTSTHWTWIRFRLSFLVTVTALVKAYFATGHYSLFWEDLLWTMSARGWPLTIPLSRSLQVLLGHLTWVAMGSLLLWALPRPAFFATVHAPPANDTVPVSNSPSSSIPTTRYTPPYHWFQWSSQDWLWWSIGGYYVSSFLFNVADGINHLVLPTPVLQQAAESVVAQLVQPEHNDVWASLIGYLAPCVSAPVWEEVLYRGFALAGLSAATGSWPVACVVQALVFSAHHMSLTAALPLAVLGWTWAVLYTHSRNLVTVVVVHALWNSRVFLGSWWGL